MKKDDLRCWAKKRNYAFSDLKTEELTAARGTAKERLTRKGGVNDKESE